MGTNATTKGCAGTTNIACYDTNITGQNIIVGLLLNSATGLACYCGFVLFRSRFGIYYKRLLIKGLASPPPVMRLGGWAQLYSWLVPVFTTSDAQLLRSCGLDALVAQRILGFGIIALAPMTALGIGVLLPVNYTSWESPVGTDTDYLTSAFLRMTISALPDGSPLLWLHFAFVYIFCAWVCWLLTLYYNAHLGLCSWVAGGGLKGALPEEAEGLQRGLRSDSEGTREAVPASDATGLEQAGGDQAGGVPGAGLPPGAEGAVEEDDLRGLMMGPAPVRPGFGEGRYALLVLDAEDREFSKRPSERSWVQRLHPGNLAKAKAATFAPPRTLRMPSRRNVERRGARIASVEATLRETFGGDFDRIIPMKNYQEADGLMGRLNDTRARLERAELAAELADARAKAKGPAADAVLDASAAAGAAAAADGGVGAAAGAESAGKGSRATSNNGAAGGRKDRRAEERSLLRLQKAELAVATLREKVTALEELVATAQAAAAAGPDQPCFLATFRTQGAAAFAAGVNLNPPQHCLVSCLPAPDPANINWTALRRGWRARTLRPLVVQVVIVCIMLLPIGLFSGAAGAISSTICNTGRPPENSTLAAPNNWFCGDDWFAGVMRSLVSGLLPSILLTVYQSVVLPRVLYAAAQAESRSFSFSALERRMAHWFFLFDVFNVFLGAMLGGSIFAGLRGFIQDPTAILSILGEAVPSASNFFVNYVMTQALLMVPFRLFWPHAAMLGFILRWLRILPAPRTARDRAATLPQRNQRYGRDIGVILFTVLIMVSSYAIVTPIILPFGLLYFCLAWVVWRYQMLYVYQDFFFSGGHMWPYFAHRVVGCLALMVTFSASMLAIKKLYSSGAILFVTGNTLLWWFKGHLENRFDSVLAKPPVATVRDAPRCEVDPLLYTPPALRPGGRGWFPEHSKAWLGWGAPREGL